jgi:hypothetical protein
MIRTNNTFSKQILKNPKLVFQILLIIDLKLGSKVDTITKTFNSH